VAAVEAAAVVAPAGVVEDVEAAVAPVADRAVAWNAAEVDPVAGWSVAAAVDLVAGFHPKVHRAMRSVKAQRWVLMAAGA
jgi:hypothetical protein